MKTSFKKPLYLSFGILLGSLSLSASAGSLSEEYIRDFCSSDERLAASIMTSRQDGAKLSKWIEFARSREDEQSRKYIEALVRWAYSEPKFTSDAYKEEAVNKFSNQVYMRCVETLKKR